MKRKTRLFSNFKLNLVVYILILIFISSCKKDENSNINKKIYIINSEKDLEQFKIKSNSGNLSKGLIPVYTTYYFPAAQYYFNTSITIADCSYIIYYGDGENTEFFANATLDILFKICSNVTDLTIKDMKISRWYPPFSPGAPTNTCAIGSHWGITNVYKVNISGLTIENMPVGISVGGHGLGYDNVVISNNHVIHSSYLNNGPGQGYGIQSDGANYMRIENNIIEYSGRHSIYVTNGLKDIIVNNNLILNNCIGQNQYEPNAAAISIARSQNVLVENNKILNSSKPSLALEWNDGGTGYDSKNLIAINNDIIGGHSKGIYLSTGIPNLLYGNKIIMADNGTEIYKDRSSTYFPSDTTSSPYEPNELVYMSGYYYEMLKNNTLRKIYPDRLINCLQNDDQPTSDNFQAWWDSQVTLVSTANWYNFEAMENSCSNSKLYIVQNGVLHEVDPNDFSYVYSSQIWYNVKGIAAAQGYVIIMQASPNDPNSGYLHRVDLNYPFNYIHNPNNFDGFQKGMCSWNDSRVFLYYDSYLYEVNPIDLTYHTVIWPPY